MSGEPAINPEYVGFWSRVLAAFIDTLAITVSAAIIIYPIFGADALMGSDNPMATAMQPADVVQMLIGAAFVMGFWFYISSTPGKLVLNAYIVDADTLRRPRPWQIIVRYLGYYVCILTLMIGFIWVGIDRRKQGLHDKMARTVVIRGKPHGEDARD